jgi:Ca2+-binding RTX toxin-like protein
MDGGAGSDTYYLNYDAADTIKDSGTSPNDVDTVIMPYDITSYTLPTNIENGTIKVGTQATSLTGNTSNNNLTGNDGANTLNGGLGNDTLMSAGGNDSVNAGDGNDEIVGGSGAGNDTYQGGTGIDTIKYSSAINPITVNLQTGTASGINIGTDTLYGIENVIAGQGNDTLNGSINNDSLSGSTGNDTLNGSTGNDSLNGGAGNDSMTGGNGSDTYYVNSTLDKVIESSSSNVMGVDIYDDTVIVSSQISAYTLPPNIENVTIDVGTTPSEIVGNAEDNNMIGNEANNTLIGGAGNDTFLSAGGNDSVSAGDGNDKIIGGLGPGDDFYDGGSYNDTIWYTSAIHSITVNLKSGSASGSDIGNDTLKNVENVVAGQSNDTITGSDDNNTIDGYTGADSMSGGLGNDTYQVDATGDQVVEAINEGIDLVKSTITYTLPSNVENLALSPPFEDTAIKGTGNGLANTINGNKGDNTLDGGVGNDTLTGGDGKDVFKLTNSSDDTITDFVVTDDTIQLENAAFTKLTVSASLNSAFLKIGTAATESNDYIIYNQTTGTLFYDADGNGGGLAEKIALLGTDVHPILTAADFSVI